jgi:hypothetical protein
MGAATQARPADGLAGLLPLESRVAPVTGRSIEELVPTGAGLRIPHRPRRIVRTEGDDGVVEP